MTKFKVCVQQYVEETASILIEAETADKAVEIAEKMLRDGDVDDWHDGDDVVGREPYAVLDEAGDPVWER